MKRALAVVLMSAALASSVFAQARETTLDSLMAAFAKMPGLEASFVEEKHIAMLAQPLSSRGKLFFARPGMLLRRTESPTRSELVITPKALRMRDDSGEQVIDLHSRPDVRPFIESLTWLLSGDRAALAKVYALDLQAAHDGAPWQLTLTPLVDPLKQLIAAIRVRGKGLAVSEIEVREKRGDETITRIESANPARQFSRAELTQLFGVAPDKASGAR
jgi:outer membrane lipoprotein-sorting protein